MRIHFVAICRALRPACVLIAVAALAWPAALHAQREKLPPDDLDIVMQKWPTAMKTYTGLRYIVEQPGHGKPPNGGDMVYVLYTGQLLDGKVFDRNQDRANPFKFRVDRFAVVPGFDQAVQMMTVGEKLLVILPSDLAYGVRGSPPIIQPDTTLVFEIELLRIDREQ